MALLNTTSLVKHSTELADLIVENKIDILTITETWLHEAASHAAALATPEGYKIVRSDRTYSVGGGVAFIYRDCLDLHIVSTSDIHECEHIFVKLLVNYNVSVSLLLLYRPPYKLPSFEEQLMATILANIKPTSHLIILGDFNYAFLNDTNAATASLLSALTAAGLQQHVFSPTHVDGNILDWVLAYNTSVLSLEVCPCPWSDHCLISFILPLPAKPARVNTIPRQFKTIRDIKKVTPAAFTITIAPLLASLPDADEVTILAEQFRSITCTAIDQLAPTKQKMVKPETTRASWFSEIIIKARQIKRAAERTWRRQNTEANRDAYRLAARAYKQSIMNAKREDFNNRIDNSKSNSKALFSILRELEGKKRTPIGLDRDAAWCITIQDAFASKIQLHQESIKKRQADLRGTSIVTSHAPDRSHQAYPPFSFRLVTEAEIYDIVKSLKPTVCKGDVCPAEVIKASLTILIPLITKIVNASFSSSFVPPDLKQAWITPLLKKEGLDPSNTGNYRPITNVPFMLKILDRVAYIQIQAYLEQYNLLGSRQSGFRANHGTESALLDLKNNIIKIIEKGSPALLMLLDLSAAFDLVSHSTLITRLTEEANFSTEAASWINSFLSDRASRVFVGNHAAPPTLLTCGVPQGSCLSPTLFNLYMRPLFDALDDLGVGYTNYADDTQVFFNLTGNYGVDLGIVNHTFSFIQSWMAQNCLALNDNKTELLILGSRQRLAKLGPEYKVFAIADCNIPVANAVKTLGVYLDSNLSMQKHVAHLHSSCSYLIKLLHQIRPYLTLENRALLACALVNARLDYCSGLLVGTSRANLEKLQIIQNGAVRAIFGLKRRDHVSEVRSSLHWLPVRQRIVFKTATLVHKCISGQAPAYLKECINIAPVRRVLRSNSKNLLNIPRYRLEGFGGTSFYALAPRIWNTLSPELRNSTNLLGFKKLLKTSLFKDNG